MNELYTRVMVKEYNKTISETKSGLFIVKSPFEPKMAAITKKLRK